MSLPSAKKLLLSSGAKRGQAAFTTPGTYRWRAPRGVRSVCVACGGAGSGLAGGGGGGLGWKNNIPVVPGQEYLVVVAGVPDVGVAGGDSYFIRADLVCGKGGGALGGSFVGDGGGKGGDGGGSGNGAGGAGGYTGPGGPGGGGGAAGRPGQGGGGAGGDANMAGGGVGMFGQGASGAGSSAGGSGGEAGTIALGGRFGGGASGRAPGEAYRGGQGFVRILHGANRAFPATKTGDV